MNVETPTQIKSAEERMLIKATKDFQQVMQSILCAPVQVNLSVSGALDSKVAYMGEINEGIKCEPNRIRISKEEIEINVYSKSYLPY